MGLVFTHGSLATLIRKLAFPTTKDSETAWYLQHIAGWIDYYVILYSQVTGECLCVFFKQKPKFCLPYDKLVVIFANVNSVDVDSKEFMCQYNTHVSSMIMSPLH